MSKKIPKTLQELNLVDRFLFDEAMEIPRVYETVVGILLERKLRFLDEVQTEKEFWISWNISLIQRMKWRLKVIARGFTLSTGPFKQCVRRSRWE